MENSDASIAMNELTPRQVKITDAFWSPRLAVNARQTIFHQWHELEKSGESQMTVWINA